MNLIVYGLPKNITDILLMSSLGFHPDLIIELDYKTDYVKRKTMECVAYCKEIYQKQISAKELKSLENENGVEEENEEVKVNSK